jgi:uncharacterized protein
MVVGVGLLDFRIFGCGSLKEKRSVLSRVIKRTQNEFNISIAEVGDNDQWQKAKVGFCMVGNDKPYINAKMDHVLHFVDQFGAVEVVRSRIEITSFSDMMGDVGNLEEGKYS